MYALWGFPKKKKERMGQREYLQKTMIEESPNFMKDLNINIQEVQVRSIQKDPYQDSFQLLNKHVILKAAREK